MEFLRDRGVMEFELVKIGPSALVEFVASWEEAFSRKLESLVYDWIFDSNNIIYAAVIEGSIAAGYCLYPLSCILHSDVRIALLCNNVFVNPKFQGRQLFVKLGKAALENAGQNGWGEIAFGIPNALALPGHKRVGWGVQEPIRFLEKKIESKEKQSAIWIYGELTSHQRSDIEKCSRISSVNRAFSILKTENFVQWRYESKPGAKYWFGLSYDDTGNLAAYCVCKFYEPSGSLHFIDIDGYDSAAISTLIKEAAGLPGDFGRINVWSYSAHCDSFIEAGFRFCGKEDSLIFIAPKDRSPLYFHEGVNISLGDNDVY